MSRTVVVVGHPRLRRALPPVEEDLALQRVQLQVYWRDRYAEDAAYQLSDCARQHHGVTVGESEPVRFPVQMETESRR